MTGDDVVARARALLGVRFRAQGRAPELGLDCIGVVAMVFGMSAVRRDYDLRSSDAGMVDGEFAASGFLRIAVKGATAGDVLLVRPGPGRLHVVILSPTGFVHADAGLRRVVEVPGAVAWPVVSAWRHPDSVPDRPSPPPPSIDLRSTEPLAAPPRSPAGQSPSPASGRGIG